MDQETMERIKLAGEYQKKAIRALFPEKAAEHLDVIEHEIKSMIMEAVVDIVKQEMQAKETEQHMNNKSSKVKKVTIG